MITDKAIISRLVKLNAGFLIRYEAASYVEDPITGRPKQKSDGCVHCDIFDMTVGERYATASSKAGEADALKLALDMAEQSPKPLTPAQKADQEAQRSTIKGLEQRAIAAEEEIAKLKRQLADADAVERKTRIIGNDEVTFSQSPPPATTAPTAPRRGGRKPGSKNKPKNQVEQAGAAPPPPPPPPENTPANAGT